MDDDILRLRNKEGIEVSTKLNGLGKFEIQFSLEVVFCSDCIYQKIERSLEPYNGFDLTFKLICKKENKKVEGCLSSYDLNTVEIPEWCPILKELL